MATWTNPQITVHLSDLESEFCADIMETVSVHGISIGACTRPRDDGEWHISFDEAYAGDILDECKRLKEELQEAIEVISHYGDIDDEDIDAAVEAYTGLYDKIRAAM